ncbi:MAG: GNAT family N-acetyltransferase [Candidatus Acidiferrales bacterium]
MNEALTEEQIKIRRLASADEARFCAGKMASSEPWRILRRSYEDSLRIFQNPERENYVAVAGDRFAGFLVLDMNGPFRGYIQSVYVEPEFRCRGLGSRLMQFAEERIFREAPNIFVCVSSFNPRARQLYERLGYELVGELRDYIVAGHSEFLLRKAAGPLLDFAKPVSRPAR